MTYETDQGQSHHQGHAEAHEPIDAAAGTERTGNPAVDSVLDSLDHLDGRPVAEHVAVFEAAHDKLRSALSDAGNDAATGPRDGA